MALCITFDVLNQAGRPVTNSAAQQPSVALSGSPATKTGDQYACPVGDYLLMTVAEVNTPPEFVLDLPALGITPEHIVIVASLGAALVLSSYFSGWGVGLAKDLIKKI